MAAPNIPWVSPEEFLDMEERSETKHHYYRGLVTPLNGESTAIAGGSTEHALLAANFVKELGSRVGKRGCRVFASDLMVQIGPNGLLTYPDVTAVCGPFQRSKTKRNVITNPVFVAEVLSPSTEARDRGEKSQEFRRTPSIKQYALVSQSEPLIEVHTRHDDGSWRITEFAGTDAILDLTSLDCRIPLADLYDGVFDE